jgi:hypothetical protein
MTNLNFSMQSVLFSMFGGIEKFDCWLTQIAETLADVNNPRVKPIKLDEKMFPPMVQGLMRRPHEVVDGFLEMLEGINTWEYKIKGNGGLSQVIDMVSGHVIEEGNESELIKKYEGNK